MATKQQVVNALAKHCEGANLINEDWYDAYSVEIEAPTGHHWQGNVHCWVVPSWFKSDHYTKSKYWDFVLEEIAMLPEAVPCIDKDCEGIAAYGECEYWGN